MAILTTLFLIAFVYGAFMLGHISENGGIKGLKGRRISKRLRYALDTFESEITCCKDVTDDTAGYYTFTIPSLTAKSNWLNGIEPATFILYYETRNNRNLILKAIIPDDVPLARCDYVKESGKRIVYLAYGTRMESATKRELGRLRDLLMSKVAPVVPMPESKKNVDPLNYFDKRTKTLYKRAKRKVVDDL